MYQPGVEIPPGSGTDRQLDQIFSYPLTVLCAPAGFGKTAALRGLVRRRGLDSVWLSLPGAGCSPVCCWELLCVQIGRHDAALGVRLGSLGFPRDAPALTKLVELICARGYAAPTLVVVDDYHLVDCPAIADLVGRIAGERITNLHVVLLARCLPALPAGELERRGLCCLMGQEDVRFRPEERGRPPELADYEARTGPDRALLRALSWLDAVTPEEASAVLEDPEAGDRLLALAGSGALLEYDGSLSAYRLNGHLRAPLQEEARRMGADPCALWRRAGRWFLEGGEQVPAYDYLCRAGDMETILRDMDRLDAQDIRFAQFPQVHKIFEGLPAETAYRYPLATLRHLRVKALSEPPSARGALERRLRELEAHFLSADLPGEERGRILGEIHNTWIFVAFNDAHAVVAHAEKAVDYFAGRTSCIVSSDSEFTFGAPHLLYCYYNEPGSLRERAEFISGHFHTLARAVEGCGAGSEPLALAEYALETGDFDRVEPCARQAMEEAERYRQTSIELCATFALARLRLYQGSFGEGLALLTDLADRVAGEDSSVHNTTAELCLAYVNSCYGKAEAIPAWLRENDMGTGNFLFQGVAFPYIVCLRAVLLSGAYVRLEVLCQEFSGRFALYRNQLGFIYCGIALAVAREKLYGIEAGCEELEKALVLAAGDGVVLPFAESALGIIPMLRKMRGSRRVPPAFLERVVACCEAYHQSILGRLPSAVALTDREREILRLLEQGLKHDEIAARLSISVPTVRYHVKNAYQKLEVNNKASAIQKAKGLGLI